MKKRPTFSSKSALKVLSLAVALGVTPALYAQNVTFSGTVFLDANGLKDTTSAGLPNPTINGAPIGTISTGGGAMERQIYVYLLETVGTFPSTFTIVRNKAAVSTMPGSPGTYSLQGIAATNYNLSVSLNDVNIGSGNPGAGFPDDVIQPTGEGFQQEGDGTPDYGVGVNTETNLVVNFGIDRRPIGLNYTVSTPGIIHGPAPDLNHKFDSLTVPPAAFTAADQEDGTYPTGLKGRPVHLFKAEGGSLYYNGKLITELTINAATVIHNFNSDSIRFVRTPNAQAFSFSFAAVDNAGINQFIGNKITLIAQPLPVPLFSFEVKRQGTSALVQWSAPAEAAGLGFDVERSTDGRNFINIGHVASVTEGNAAVDYRFEDTNLPSNTVSGKVYYRLRQTAYNGQADYSKVAILSASALFEGATAKLSLYPNPASNVLNVSMNGAPGQPATVVLSDATGRIVNSKTTNSEGIATLEVASLPAGMYFVQYRTANSELITTERIAITR